MSNKQLAQLTTLVLGAVGGFVNPQGRIILIISPLEYFGHNGHLKILIGCVWGKEGVERGQA